MTGAGDDGGRTGRPAGFEFYRRAVAHFPDAAALHQGLCLCAGHQGHHEVALAAAEAALTLEPDNQEVVNDMGWTLYERGGTGPRPTVPTTRGGTGPSGRTGRGEPPNLPRGARGADVTGSVPPAAALEAQAMFNPSASAPSRREVGGRSPAHVRDQRPQDSKHGHGPWLQGARPSRALPLTRSNDLQPTRAC